VNLAQSYRDRKILGWDRWIRFRDPARMTQALSVASKKVSKRPFVVIVESHTKYGNSRAFAAEYAKTHAPDEYLFLATGYEGVRWAKKLEIPAAKFRLNPSPENSIIWDLLFRASVAVYESHDFWRSREAMFKRALLSGAYRIQLWHGSTGPIGKEIGLARLAAQPAMWHFTALATTSVGWDELVCEPNADEARRLDRVQAKTSIHDIEFRLVEVLRSGEYVKPTTKRIAVTPTFPETTEGEDAIIDWVVKLGASAKDLNCDVDVFLHPSSKPRLRKAIESAKGIELSSSRFRSEMLRNYSAIVTDFSSIAHDALLVGTPVIMVTVDLDNYVKSREILKDEEQWEASYVVGEISFMKSVLEDCLGRDSKQLTREQYRSQLLSKIQGQPGDPTIAAVDMAVIASRFKSTEEMRGE
jgi:hypothetical protein